MDNAEIRAQIERELLTWAESAPIIGDPMPNPADYRANVAQVVADEAQRRGVPVQRSRVVDGHIVFDVATPRGEG